MPNCKLAKFEKSTATINSLWAAWASVKWIRALAQGPAGGACNAGARGQAAAGGGRVGRVGKRPRPPTWNKGFATAVALLRSVAMRAPRDIAALRVLTDTAIPKIALPMKIKVKRMQLGALRCERFTVRKRQAEEKAAEDRAVLYFHGGAYCLCNNGTHRMLCAQLALRSGVPLYSVEYRRPPEHPYPTAVLDVLGAWRSLVQELGLDPRRIMLAGDSSGGGLTTSLLCALRDGGWTLPAGAVLLSPWIELGDLRRESWRRNARIDYLPSDCVLMFARAYAGTRHLSFPGCSPIFADLGGLPPLLVEVGEGEVLHSQIMAFVARARHAGVDVTCEPAVDMVHVYQLFSFLCDKKALASAGCLAPMRLAPRVVLLVLLCLVLCVTCRLPCLAPSNTSRIVRPGAGWCWT